MSPVIAGTGSAAAEAHAADAKPSLALPEGYHFRALRESDFDNGLFKCLAQLTVVNEVSQSQFSERFSYMMARPDTYYVHVIAGPSGQIVAAGTLLVERKFIRGCGLAGHIEDIVVDGEQRGRNLGKILLDRLKLLAQELGCYKVILDCERDRVGFYEKCGFTEKGSQMTVYF